MDVLSEELTQARASGAVFSVLTRRGAWGLAFSGRRPLTAHVLLAGSGFFEIPGAEPVAVQAGDIALVTAGAPYRLVSAPGERAEPIEEARAREGGVPSEGDARILCGAYRFEGGLSEGILTSLPRLLILPAGEQEPAHRSVLGLLGEEVGSEGAGQQVIRDRILDLALVYTLRTWWGRDDSEAPGWYRGLADPRLSGVLRLLHADPAAAHPVPVLAAQAGLSRAAFAARFQAVVGRSPARYLTELRMRRAADALVRTDHTLARIAVDVGYRNEYAFSTAFRREFGSAPGAWRRSRNIPR